jgi:hypothetical protein
MTLNTSRARELLVKCDLRALFINELGWDRHTAILKVTVDGSSLDLHALAQKRGMVAYHFPTPSGQVLPEYSHRRKIEHQVAKSAHEHLIVFTDADSGTQIWQWVKREPGKPAACREHTFHRSQPGDALLQKLSAIAFTLEEEDRIALPDVTRRARAGFDVEKVTKRFYDRFQKEHTAFLKFINGITPKTDREWYASVMLNRLMFVYFIQRKGFLDGDRDYLRNRLSRMRTEHGQDKFYSFYRYFLLRLFHEGLGGKARTRELEKLVGRIPYLNGGLFDVHELEKSDRYGKAIQIPDSAFERIFDYFDQYQWHLDERPLRADNEINPDVLGYIFEKYINQKQMGAYYTKEDITEYISKNTVLPFLFDTARAKCKVAFENAKGPTVWDMLRDDPDRYIYYAVRHGAGETLPADIAAGLSPLTLHKAVGDGRVKTVDLRKGWNKPAPGTHGLPTETWREVVARRTRYEEIKTRLVAGEVRDINELVTLNLDIRQFAQDAIENCEGPDLLRAFWHAIEKVTILDPTCGSGAFLFAALNILETLYEACLDRMQSFIEDLARSGEKHRPEKYSDFRKVLGHVAAHPNRRYFIFKSIILNNLFGVDIMEEAVEICKLRLFLKLAAQVEPDAARENFGIEPLPDIDFNIRAGNTLVGYATLDAVKQAVGSKLDFDNAAEKIAIKAADLQQAFDAFRSRQIQGDGSVPPEDKKEIRNRLIALDDELNGHLASEFGIDLAKKGTYAKWLTSHRPFHWFVQFYGIMERGGFDVVVGNPPYIVNVKGRIDYTIREQDFATFSAKNLYAFIFERSTDLARTDGPVGLIVQLTVLSSERLKPLQDLLSSRGPIYTPAFPRRPESIFDGVEMPVAIVLSVPVAVKPGERNPGAARGYVTSRVGRFYTEERDHALFAMSMFPHAIRLDGYRIAKIGSSCEHRIFQKLTKGARSPLGSLALKGSKWVIYYQEACRYWAKACHGLPYFKRNGKKMEPPHGRIIPFTSDQASSLAACVLNSSLFYWYYSAFADCEHINDGLVRRFPVPADWQTTDWSALSRELTESIKEHSKRKIISTKQGHQIEYDEMKAVHSKPVIDRIDHALAQTYGFSEEEVDFLIHYDIKYRMGPDAGGDDE